MQVYPNAIGGVDRPLGVDLHPLDPLSEPHTGDHEVNVVRWSATGAGRVWDYEDKDSAQAIALVQAAVMADTKAGYERCLKAARILVTRTRTRWWRRNGWTLPNV